MNTTLKHISPQKAAELLKKDGIVMSERDAKALTDYLYEIGDIIVDIYIRQASETNQDKKIIPLKR